MSPLSLFDLLSWVGQGFIPCRSYAHRCHSELAEESACPAFLFSLFDLPAAAPVAGLSSAGVGEGFRPSRPFSRRPRPCRCSLFSPRAPRGARLVEAEVVLAAEGAEGLGEFLGVEHQSLGYARDLRPAKNAGSSLRFDFASRRFQVREWDSLPCMCTHTQISTKWWNYTPDGCSIRAGAEPKDARLCGLTETTEGRSGDEERGQSERSYSKEHAEEQTSGMYSR